MKANPDDLLVLLAVARSAKFTTAAQTLGLNHTTVSRRIAALEKALGGRVLSRAAGGWELTDLGVEAAQVGERVEEAVRALEQTRPHAGPDHRRRPDDRNRRLQRLHRGARGRPAPP
ncbi:DNA-binding transcriptional LysR family regulator [Arthrobacter sp. V4I6]|nr:DNA-binding transcriptional LysR family regulator [Arthrobacter sp. V4I6]